MDRREAIADAAIDVLAAEGARGLTHRAIDRHLDLPTGSTSYYYRTRLALIRAASDRLVALDRKDVDAIGGDPAKLAGLIDRWLRPANRPRVLARFELFLAAVRSPDDADLAAARADFRAEIADAFAAAGIQHPDVAATKLMATLDGLLLNGILDRNLTRRQRRSIIDAALARPHHGP